MAYRGTRGAAAAATAAVLEKDEHRHAQSAGDLVGLSRDRVTANLEPKTSTAAQNFPTKATAPRREAYRQEEATCDELTKRVMALQVVDDRSSTPGRKIETIAELKQQLEGMCRTVFATLGRQQTESAYQMALKIELEDRGVAVQQEVKISITYRDIDISSRRVDLLLTLRDGCTAIVEMKAVSTLTKGNNLNAVHQLQYYLDVFDVNHGFLVNFPHDAGFPPPPNGGIFRQEPICGVVGPLSDVRVRERKASNVGNGPEIVYFRRVL
ncbi:unnamed protein product [Ectocarpus sp. CCAP 1310/34]|nr:unnamed protein product [Ectocarpus sp. CCAP 1310/34]